MLFYYTVLLCLGFVWKAFAEGQCTIPDGSEGDCVSAELCPDLVDLAHTIGSFDIMKKSNCGYDGMTAKVCCPVSLRAGFRRSTTPNYWILPRRNSKPKTTTMSPNFDSRFDEIPRHRNYRLLPQETCGPVIMNKIVNGETAGIEEFPWMALLYYRYSNGKIFPHCGGSLISEKYVLTAAHCVLGLKNRKLESVRLGEYYQSKDQDCVGSVCSPPVQDIVIQEVVPHESYDINDTGRYHDIALLRLQSAANLNAFVQPICLPLNDLLTKNYDGRRLTVAGWGKTTNDDRDPGSDVKLKVDVPVVAKDKCQRLYRKLFTLNFGQMCAGGEGGKDSCGGDSGGPLMSTDLVNKTVRYHATGIVSFGPECGTAPAIYNRVAEYVPWILDHMKP